MDQTLTCFDTSLLQSYAPSSIHVHQKFDGLWRFLHHEFSIDIEALAIIKNTFDFLNVVWFSGSLSDAKSISLIRTPHGVNPWQLFIESFESHKVQKCINVLPVLNPITATMRKTFDIQLILTLVFLLGLNCLHKFWSCLLQKMFRDFLSYVKENGYAVYSSWVTKRVILRKP